MVLRYSLVGAACFVTISVAASAMPRDQLKSANACRALVVDPASAINLRRPPALRYRSPPLLICMPEYPDHAPQLPMMALTQ
jgi:hypothetical protein